LAQHHAGSPRIYGMRDTLRQLAFGPIPKAEAFLSAVLERCPDRESRAIACFALATAAAAKADVSGDRNTMPALTEKANRYYKQVLDEFADVTNPGILDEPGKHKLGERAKRQLEYLASLKKLEPGEPAPEVDGSDLDGKAFRLSDYKGKVVMLS